MKTEYAVGTAQAKPGQRATGAIPVGRRAGGGPIEIPLILVNGRDDGPVLWIDGAVHGDEPEGPLAVLRLMEIGRASCRERVEMSVVAVTVKKKKRQNNT